MRSAFHPCLVSACSRRWWWPFRSSSPPISCTRPAWLGALSHLDLVVPLVAVASFAIAAVAIGLLVRVSTRAAQAPAMPAGNWQEELCRTALGSLDLSPREFDVAVLAYRGYSAKKIASTLYVSESTVKTHTSHVYRKDGHSFEARADRVHRRLPHRRLTANP